MDPLIITLSLVVSTTNKLVLPLRVILKASVLVPKENKAVPELFPTCKVQVGTV